MDQTKSRNDGTNDARRGLLPDPQRQNDNEYNNAWRWEKERQERERRESDERRKKSNGGFFGW